MHASPHHKFVFHFNSSTFNYGFTFDNILHPNSSIYFNSNSFDHLKYHSPYVDKCEFDKSTLLLLFNSNTLDFFITIIPTAAPSSSSSSRRAGQ